MRTICRRRSQGLVLAVLTLIVGLADRAQAQQTGLFPLAPIRRQRVPCDQQDPTYKIHKYQYFGYHPTCWRPFPAGWGCPSPEAPDKAESFRQQKFDAGIDNGTPRPEDMQGQPELLKPAMPTLPGGGVSPFDQPGPGAAPNAPRGGAVTPSPFDLERKDPTPGAAPNAPPAGGAVNPSPFELDRKDPAPGAAPNAPRAGRDRPAAAPAGADGPELSAPTAASDRSAISRFNRSGADEEIGTREEDGPVLALSNPISIPPADDAASPFGAQPTQVAPATADPGSNQAASPAPRRGFLSGLFNNLGWNWSRR
jgi:hypothetical protein